MGSGLPWISAN